jgi:hypothetical protein
MPRTTLCTKSVQEVLIPYTKNIITDTFELVLVSFIFLLTVSSLSVGHIYIYIYMTWNDHFKAKVYRLTGWVRMQTIDPVVLIRLVRGNPRGCLCLEIAGNIN